MSSEAPALRWLHRVDRAAGPIYVALADALEKAVRSGELQPGDRLPPQRTVAHLLSVDLTTVTRGYAVARERGLLEGATGRGTFVKVRASEDDAGLVDFSMNLPPPPLGISLAAMLGETAARVLQGSDPSTLMAYHPGAGTFGQRVSAAGWLAPHVGRVGPERVLVTSGAQTALAAVLSTVTRPGDRILVEPLSYPGLKALAQQLGLRMVACASDDEGILPHAVERACREASPAALYVVPNMHNPTARTMSPERRRAIARLATSQGFWIVEDDPYARLIAEPEAALAALAPDRTFHVATLSKCLSPGLRVAFLVCPDEALTARLNDGLRAISLMTSPLMAAVANTWIREGQADDLLAAVRAEAVARRQIAAEVLPEAYGQAESIHVWLDLPPSWSAEKLRTAASQRGFSLVSAEAFATGPEFRNGVRISLGGPSKRATIKQALMNVSDLLVRASEASRFVV